MKNRLLFIVAATSALLTLGTGCTPPSNESEESQGSASTSSGASRVAPALANYNDTLVRQGLWEREGLSPRDRSLTTLAAMIANNQTADLPYYVSKALDDGVEPGEISETLTHLAFYSGWQNAMGAVPAIEEVFNDRDVDAATLPAVDPELLPLDETAEQTRAETVEADFGQTSPGVVESTRDVLFRDLWLRPGLEPRDRSLITVVALVSSGQVQQIPFHLNRAMDNGLTETEVGEMLHQLAFYAGWPSVFTAMPVARDVMASRQ